MAMSFLVRTLCSWFCSMAKRPKLPPLPKVEFVYDPINRRLSQSHRVVGTEDELASVLHSLAGTPTDRGVVVYINQPITITQLHTIPDGITVDGGMLQHSGTGPTSDWFALAFGQAAKIVNFPPLRMTENPLGVRTMQPSGVDPVVDLGVMDWQSVNFNNCSGNPTFAPGICAGQVARIFCNAGNPFASILHAPGLNGIRLTAADWVPVDYSFIELWWTGSYWMETKRGVSF